jgi:RimJ/RimL family protein N-acetyltransferase
MSTPTATAADYLVRPFVSGDAPSMLAAVRASLPDLAYWMPWCKPDYALADAQGWVEFAQQAWVARSEFPLGIFEAASGAVVGGTGINHLVPAYRMGNLGYWVSTPHTGRGVARWAAGQAARLAFGELGLTRLEIVALTHNQASQRVAQALGATFEGLARHRLYLQGAPHDAVVYSLLPSDLADWDTRRGATCPPGNARDPGSTA